jgi:uncharacterized integral membrane protein (TIGR00698 family)
MTSIAYKSFMIALFLLFLLVPNSGAVALMTGICISLVFGNPDVKLSRTLATRFLQFSIIGLGGGLNIIDIGRSGLIGFIYTALGISVTFLLGLRIGKAAHVQKNTSLLLTAGTAICGGSAIAAVAPTIRAKPAEVSIALATVFLLNALGLLIFPWIGHRLHLSETQFGLWSALSIHDTSSVVGAAMQYGTQSLEVATTVKLARAIWIVPVTMIIGILVNRQQATKSAQKPRFPIFILGFILLSALVTFVPSLRSAGQLLSGVSKKCLVGTLFLIGTSLTRETIQNVGFRPLIQGVSLWLLMATLNLAIIMYGLIPGLMNGLVP